MPDLLLAAATVDVTPPPGHAMDGYADRNGVATGTADPLRATLIWLSTPEEPGVAWLSLDAVAVSTTLAGRLADALPIPDVLVCATHTHAGPAGWSGSIHPLLPAEQEESLQDALVAAISAMRLHKTPVEPYWCAPDAPGVGANRHRIDGPHDTSAGVLSLRARDGQVRAVLLDHACHPTVLGPDTLSWSADWPGATRRALAQATPVVAFLQGAAGDVSPRFVRRSRDLGEVARLGNRLAEPVSRDLPHAIRVRAEPPRLHRTTVTLPTRTLPSRHEGGDCLGARGQLALMEAGLPSEMELPLSVVTLGDLAWVHLPVELFAALGARIARHSPFPTTRVIGYTDGYFGYVADRQAHDDGAYEARMSYFAPETADTLVEAALGLLREASG